MQWWLLAKMHMRNFVVITPYTRYSYATICLLCIVSRRTGFGRLPTAERIQLDAQAGWLRCIVVNYRQACWSNIQYRGGDTGAALAQGQRAYCTPMHVQNWTDDMPPFSERIYGSNIYCWGVIQDWCSHLSFLVYSAMALSNLLRFGAASHF